MGISGSRDMLVRKEVISNKGAFAPDISAGVIASHPRSLQAGRRPGSYPDSGAQGYHRPNGSRHIYFPCPSSNGAADHGSKCRHPNGPANSHYHP